ncbi:hypothetical protein [Halobacillus mangrovi]|uniref:hypothetical protein n=1 Tax=Halobacillus mangrovi TaxID=402384 RepID=UPI003D97F6E2
MNRWFMDNNEESNCVEETFEVEPGQLTFSGDLGIGEVDLSCKGSSQASVRAVYNKNSPKILFSHNHLKVSQLTKVSNPWKKDKHNWRVQLPKINPLVLKLNLGVGSSNIDLTGVSLRKLKVSCGVGDLHLHLTNMKLTQDVPVKIDGGVGSQTITISEDLPALFKVNKGAGSFTGKGMVSLGASRYCTKSYQEGQPHFLIKLNVGVGDVAVIEEELVKSENV